MSRIRDAALDFYKARQKQKEAKAALRKFRQENGGCDCAMPCYYSQRPIDGNDEYEPWCDNCQAAQPLWETYQKSANLVGASLRRLLLLCQKEIIDKTTPTTSKT